MLEVQSAGQSVFEAAQKWEGQVLANGNFRLRRYLGGSDHSAVFLTDIGVGQIRPPAIKLMAPDPARAELQLARWKAAAKLEHQNLLQVFESGRCELNGQELLFVVTENADETLAEILRERSLTPEEASEMLKPTLEALSCLHDNGYSAGRVSPSNITALGELVKVSSDGVCRIGSPAFLAAKPYDPPEVALEGLTPAGDIWALGMTIAEALTGRVPMWNNTLRDEPIFPDNLPEPFPDIVRHCLARDPRRRWTISEIKSRLKQPVAVPVLEQPHKRKAERRAAKVAKGGNRWFYAISVIAMLVAIVLLAGLPRHHSSAQLSSSTVSQAAPVTPAAKLPAPKQSGHKESYAPQNAPHISELSRMQMAEGIVHREVPSVPEKALETIHGKVRVNVKVSVDASGNVVAVEFVSAGPSRYFANLALQAARGKFSPGKSSWLVRFVFESTGVAASEHELPSGA